MKHILAYTFLLIFSFQVLPVKELGKILFKGQMTEEVHENCNMESDDCTSKVKKDADPYHIHDYEFEAAMCACINAQVLTAIHKAANLPNYHVPDIATPPPNC